jgi:hypothetical protein
MHIVLGALGAIVTILILVNRLSDNGIDIGWLNPFAWKRRREWAKKYHANPVYSIKKPMEITGLLMIALAKSEGDMSSEQKNEIKQKFIEVFHLSEDKAVSLITSSVFLLKEELTVVKDMDKLLAASLDDFTEEQANSAYSLLRHISCFEGAPNSFQSEIVALFKKSLESRFKLNEDNSLSIG